MRNLTKFFGTLAGLSLAFSVLTLGHVASADVLPQVSSGTQSGDPAYFTIDSVETYEVDALGNPLNEVSNVRGIWTEESQASSLDTPALPSTGDPEVDGMIQFGKAVWDIVVANAPKVTTATDRVSVVPAGITDWRNLQGWSAPQGHAYRTLFKNALGNTMIDFTYRVQYTYGGNQNGKGAFLSAVTIIPNNLEVGWGYTFNAKGSIANVTNAGTTDNPIAGAEVQMDWSVDTVFKHGQYSNTYYMRGDGTYKELR